MVARRNPREPMFVPLGASPSSRATHRVDLGFSMRRHAMSLSLSSATRVAVSVFFPMSGDLMTEFDGNVLRREQE